MAAAVAAATLGTLLGGCSQLYWDRRDSIALSAGDAIAANEAEQTIDPWPPLSGNPNHAFNGQRMQAAAERYRTNTVIQPGDPMAATTLAGSSSAAQPSSNNGSSAGTTNSSAPIVVVAPAATTAASQ